jgi:hypothetical protein
MTKTALYRHFDDVGRLLYVGISLNAVTRMSQHKHSARWFDNIASVTVEWLDSRDAALAAELRAIREESPIHNKAGRIYSHAKKAAPVAIGANLEGRYVHAVVHVQSARFDGFYERQDDASGVREYLAETYANDQFAIAKIPRKSPGRLHDCDVLRASGDSAWAVSRGVSADALRRERSERLLRQPSPVCAALVRAIAAHINVSKPEGAVYV